MSILVQPHGFTIISTPSTTSTTVLVVVLVV